MIRAGFTPRNNARLLWLLYSCFMMQNTSAKDRFKFPLEKSCRVMIVPDPTGMLEPNEVFLNLALSDEDNISWGVMKGDVIVARNPAHRPCDVQRVTCVYREA